MPVVEFDYWDVRKLGVELTKQELMDLLPHIGMPVEDVEGDTIKIEATPNRPDLLSAEGIARAVKCFTGIAPKLYPAYKPSIEVYAEEVPCRPCSAFAVVHEVVMSDPMIKSIMQLQEKLHMTHGRKRAKVAIGIHDMSKARPPFKYVAKKPSDVRFVPLQCDEEMRGMEILEKIPKGGEYGHLIEKEEKWPVLMDSLNRVMALPPIINSELTRLTPKTTDLFIDVTGTDAFAVDRALTIVCSALAERGAKIEQVLVKGSFNKITPDLVPKVMRFDISYANEILGLELDTVDAATLLAKMGHFVDAKGDQLEVHIAPYRTDILHPFDLVEEIAIAYGYGNFELALPNIPTTAESDKKEDLANNLRILMVGMGFNEAFTFAMSNPERLFMKMNQPMHEIVEVMNPKTAEFTLMRDTLLPSLMEVLGNNKPSGYPQRFFECGEVCVLDPSSDTGSRNKYKLSVVIAGQEATFTNIKSIFEAILKNLNLSAEFKPANNPQFIIGRCAGCPFGIFGEVHPQVITSWGLEVPVAALEIDVEKLVSQ